MSSHIILVENPQDWSPAYPKANVVLAKDYLTQADNFRHRGAKVLNLCRSYRYLTLGYYCSLLGEARRHKVVPSVRTLTDLSSKAIYSLNVEDLDELFQKSLKKRKTQARVDTFEMLIFFGQCQYPELHELARQLFEAFRAPLLKAEFRFQGKWNLSTIKPLHLNAISPEQQAFFAETLSTYLSKRWQGRRARSIARYDIAILHNPAEQLPPSSNAALQKFIRAGKRLDVNVELIEKKDYTKLAQYDALFIRETTKIDHYTYRFAKRAESEGMVVIDDPDSIVKCTNKVYLTEILSAHKIPVPKTVVLKKGNSLRLGEQIGYPAVLKIPDGSFSRGVFKVNDDKEAEEIATRLFKESDLLLAQEFVYTDFDWRIGVLNRKPIFACQYFMSRQHWQIVKHGPQGRFSQGDAKTWPIEEAPQNVVSIAVKAANLIGDGLYGVDLKQTDKGVCVIEVNDNPNIDAKVEDACLGDPLYELIINEFVRRLDARKGR